MAVYFLEPLFASHTFYFMTLALIALIAGIYLGWLDKNTGKKAFNITRRIVGVLFILLGVFFILPGNLEKGQQIDWQPYTPAELQKARELGKPVIIDFYADWCIPCKEWDKFTFRDNRVISKSRQFAMIKADLTRYQSEETNKLRELYKIKGVPTIVFLDESGNEISNLRVSEFENAEQFIQRMNTILP
jgi:thiol:disulfide interchange protein DsbD